MLTGFPALTLRAMYCSIVWPVWYSAKRSRLLPRFGFLATSSLIFWSSALGAVLSRSDVEVVVFRVLPTILRLNTAEAAAEYRRVFAALAQDGEPAIPESPENRYDCPSNSGSSGESRLNYRQVGTAGFLRCLVSGSGRAPSMTLPASS
jgi:hypothetical protein